MDRRESLGTLAGIIGAGLLAANSNAMASGSEKPTASSADLIGALDRCRRTGIDCIEHCIEQLGSGDKNFKKCLQDTREMLAVCEAMSALLSAGDKEVKRMAAVCKSYCEECQSSCAEHKMHWDHKMHLACKDCHDACKDLVAILKRTYGV
jgi:Cys-rich four helix bundle protein (predicted Tat secretion target)